MHESEVNHPRLKSEACGGNNTSLRLTSLSPPGQEAKRGYVVRRFKTHPGMPPQFQALEVPVADKARVATKRIWAVRRRTTLARGDPRKGALPGPYGLGFPVPTKNRLEFGPLLYRLKPLASHSAAGVNRK